MSRFLTKICSPPLATLAAVVFVAFPTAAPLGIGVDELVFADGFEAPPGPGSILINEVDYVQPGIDDGEFIELYNPGAVSLPLDGMTLQLIDGLTNLAYATIPMEPVLLDAGAFYVICDDPARVPGCSQQVSLPVPWIRDSTPGGIALTGSDGVIDALSYGGTLDPPWAEGLGTSAVDQGRLEGLGLGRFPDGVDSDDNDTDFRLACISPGAANFADAVSCPTFTVSATVSGLEGSGLVLQINREQVFNLMVPADGMYSFAKELENGSDYEVRVLAQPADPNQTCTVSNDTGFIAGSDITDVEVNCVRDGTDFTVGGTASGLTPGSFVVLINFATVEQLPLGMNGPFAFVQKQADGTVYDVQTNNPPGAQVACTVSNGMGVIDGADVTDIEVVCVPTTYTVNVTASGIVGSGLVLQNNSGDDLPIPGNGSFAFSTELAQGEAYAVTVLSRPSDPSQTCFVSGGSNGDGSGAITESSANVTVTCAIDNPEPGALIITEIMADPLGTDNEGDEWFEVRNLSADHLYLTDCTISNDSSQHLIAAEALVEPGAYRVFVLSQAQAIADRIARPILYADINLDNAADSLAISCGSTVVDAVTYLGFTEGRARQLSADSQDAVSNDDTANWCDATAALPSGNLGSPGNPNIVCP